MLPRDIIKKIRRIQIHTSHIVDELLAGQWDSAFRGSGIEFEEVRPYQFGDDVRAIDWNVTARTGRPFIKLFREEREMSVMTGPLGRERRVIDVTITPLDSEFERKYLLLEISDATQRQRITRENELMARLDSSRQMVRQLAHEIKNPLGGLRGAAQLLERELHEHLREYTGVIISEADRLTALVDSMIGPSRAPQKSLINIHEICEHVYRLLRSEARAGVLVERDYDPSLPNAEVDSNQVIQALLNVARNALLAVGERGRIVIRTRVAANVSIGTARHKLAASLQVEDNGPGVPPEIADTIFFPLVTGRANGTGLGLAVSQDLVTRHGGLIEFESKPGRTVFNILLPLPENA